MSLILPVSYIVCFSSGLLLSTTLIYRDGKPKRLDGIERIAEDDYVWERVVPVLFGIISAGLSIAIAVEFTADATPHWTDVVILCTLHLHAGTNVRIPINTLATGLQYIKLARILRLFVFPRWTIKITYIMIGVSTPNILYQIK
jgi:hypothetical protein